MSIQVINHISYYQDKPCMLQEHLKGILIDERFTGIIVQGGNYADTLYSIDGHILNRDFNGDDNMEDLVNSAICSALETNNVDYPQTPKEFEYKFQDDDIPVRASRFLMRTEFKAARII